MPRQEIKKTSLVTCLKSLKLCGNKITNPKDYECLPYESVQAKNIPSPIRLQINKNLDKLSHLNKLTKQTTKQSTLNIQPEFHSTKIIDSSYQIYKHRVTSTFNQQQKNIQPVEISSNLSRISDESSAFDYSSSDYDSTTYYSRSSFSSTDGSSEFSMSQEEETPIVAPQSGLVFVCSSPYQARFQGDISLRYTERVCILHSTNDFALVKKIDGSDECGYVATKCLTSLPEFMKKIQI